MTDTVASLRDQLLQLKALHDAGALDAAAYQSARSGLERRLVDLVTADGSAQAAAMRPQPAAEPRAGKGLWIGAVLVAGVVAAGGYAWTGSPGAIGAATPPALDANAGGAAAAQSVTPQQIAAMVEKLAARLTDKPDDAEGWRMLGRSYLVLEKPAEAVAAFERYLKLRPDDAGALADYADAMAAKNGRNLEGEPLQLLQRALALDPGNLKALMLVGSAAFNRGDYATAVSPWDRMAQAGPADDPLVQQAVLAAQEARRRGNLPPPAAFASVPSASVASASVPSASVPSAAALAQPSGGPSTGPSAASIAAAPAANAAPGDAVAAPAVSGTVSLAPALQARAAPDDTVFVFARPAQGARMPLAIVRKQVKDLPFDFRLDDSLAMSPAARISGAGQVIVGARISKSGQAAPQRGDLEGLSEPVAVGSSGIRLSISTAIP